MGDLSDEKIRNFSYSVQEPLSSQMESFLVAIELNDSIQGDLLQALSVESITIFNTYFNTQVEIGYRVEPEDSKLWEYSTEYLVFSPEEIHTFLSTKNHDHKMAMLVKVQEEKFKKVEMFLKNDRKQD